MDMNELPTAALPSLDVVAPIASATSEPASPAEMDPISPEQKQAIVDDFLAGWDMDARGELEQYDKHHVCIVNGRVVDFDKDPSELWRRVEREQRIPPYRQAIIFVGDDTI